MLSRWITVAVLLFFSLKAEAACPDGNWWTLSEEVQSASFVALAKVVGERHDEGSQEGSGWIAGTFYRMNVQESLRGHPQKSFELFSENSSGRLPMSMGGIYLVFASMCDDRLYAYSKGNSGPKRATLDVAAKIRSMAPTVASSEPRRR